MGGSPIDFCTTHNIRYDLLVHWLYDDPARRDRYTHAIDARTEWIVQRILLELTRLSTADVREAFNNDGSAKRLDELSPELAACISSITVGEDGKQRVRFRSMTDKIKCLEMLGKNFAMFIERHDHTGEVAVVININAPGEQSRDDTDGIVHGYRAQISAAN